MGCTNDQHKTDYHYLPFQVLNSLSQAPPISYDTTTSLNVNLKVSDGQNTLTKAFQIAVKDLNRAPTDIGLTSNTITENTSPSTVIGTLSSVDLDTTIIYRFMWLPLLLPLPQVEMHKMMIMEVLPSTN